MSSWNAVLSSLHSSLIDELNERFPKAKPELGLPKRTSGWEMPAASEKALLSEVTVSEGAGYVALGAKTSQKDPDIAALLKAVVVRAEKDFERRCVKPVFGKSLVTEGSAFPKTWPAPQMFIWLPISVADGKNSLVFDLGVGIK